MDDIFNLINSAVFVLCYLTGSFPAAYLLVKSGSGKDLTAEGSGNVGTLNSFQVSRSKAIGLTVLLLDILKGAIPVYVILFILDFSYPAAMIGACGVLLGHNYPVWLKFKGGRGLASGAGIFIIINYYILLGWVIVWLVFFAVKRKVLIANTAATFFIPVFVFIINIFPVLALNKNIAGFSMFYFSLFSVIITAVILLRHSEVFK